MLHPHLEVQGVQHSNSWPRSLLVQGIDSTVTTNRVKKPCGSVLVPERRDIEIACRSMFTVQQFILSKCSPMCQSAINGLLRLLGRNLVISPGLRAMKIEKEWCRGKTSWMMARPLAVP